MRKVYVFFADGFEEIEALTPVDVLRRAGAEVSMVSINESLKVRSSRGVTVLADQLFEEVFFGDADMFVLPGGMPGSRNLDEHEELKISLAEAQSNGTIIAAICAAPMVLGHIGLLKGKRATCYPGNEADLKGATVTGKALEVDGNIITAKGAGSSLKFSLALVEALYGSDKAKEVADKMMVE